MKRACLFMAIFMGHHLLAQEVIFTSTWQVEEKESYITENAEDLNQYDFIDHSNLVDRSFSYTEEQTIYSDYFLERKITYSSDFDGMEEWMNRPGGFIFGRDHHYVLNQDGSIRKAYALSGTDIARRERATMDIETGGYHPGLVSFPWPDPDKISEIESNGGMVSYPAENEMLIQTHEMEILLNKNNWSIHTEKQQGLYFYENTRQYLPNADYGFLLLREITLKPFQSSGGACVTQKTEKKYSNYSIEDRDGLMEIFATPQTAANFELFPNPAESTVHINFPEEFFVHDIQIDLVLIRNTSGTVVYEINANTINTFSFELPGTMAPGTYVMEVVTSGSGSFFQTFSKV